MIKAWSKCPLPIIPKEKRLKGHRTLGICKGGCNSIKPLMNMKYQLCSNCNQKWRLYGNTCDVPDCKEIADGSIVFSEINSKVCCKGCYEAWRKKGFCIWEQFVEYRHLYFKRPEGFSKAKELGFVYPVENPVKKKTVAECTHCYKEKPIASSEYQLCSPCANELRYYGEKCSIKGVEPCNNHANTFDTDESRYICGQCLSSKSRYNLSSYLIYERNIRSVVNCNLCNRSVSHNRKEGESSCTAYIDHNHETGKTRGVLCHDCNAAEGMIKKTGVCPQEWAKKLIDYYEKSPLSQSWVQND